MHEKRFFYYLYCVLMFIAAFPVVFFLGGLGAVLGVNLIRCRYFDIVDEFWLLLSGGPEINEIE